MQKTHDHMDADFLAKGCTKIGNNWNCVDSDADLSGLPEIEEQEDSWMQKKTLIQGIKNSYVVIAAVICVLLVCCCSFMMIMMR